MSIGRSPGECRAANTRQSCHKSGGRGSPKPISWYKCFLVGIKREVPTMGGPSRPGLEPRPRTVPVTSQKSPAARRGGESATGARQLLPAALDTDWQGHREIPQDLPPFG